jgi:hypothetical protein
VTFTARHSANFSSIREHQTRIWLLQRCKCVFNSQSLGNKFRISPKAPTYKARALPPEHHWILNINNNDLVRLLSHRLKLNMYHWTRRAYACIHRWAPTRGVITTIRFHIINYQQRESARAGGRSRAIDYYTHVYVRSYYVCARSRRRYGRVFKVPIEWVSMISCIENDMTVTWCDTLSDHQRNCFAQV